MKNNNLLLATIIAAACVNSAYAATPIDLDHQSVSLLNAFSNTLAVNASALKQKSISVDFKKTTHMRLQQMYAGVPVWGGDIVVHIPKDGNTSLKNLAANPNAKMNGVLYQDLTNDLGAAPVAGSDAIVKHIITEYQKEHRVVVPVQNSHADLIVYVDDNNKAHWAYLVNFVVNSGHGLPAKPHYIMDAETRYVYQQWDNLQTINEVQGGGFGGNPKMGKLIYDGAADHLPTLGIDRKAKTGVCYLKNASVTVKNAKKKDAVATYPCRRKDADHGDLWWSGDVDAVNDAYSPSNDALYVGGVIQDMYMKWYGIPALVDSEGQPMMLNMRVHEDMENAYWDGSQMTFGDGLNTFYPLVSLGVGAHEVSHGFTEQHSGLNYYGQSGGLNEAFSDMAAQAAEFYSNGKNSWQIGPEIMKDIDALRYMDQPSKDCGGKKPGSNCSIDNASQYKSGLDVHYSSGVFNRVFYLMGTSEGWDTKKAFDVMVQANQHYWTSSTSWPKAACGVLSATKDLGYDLEAVKKALTTVEVDFSKC